MYKGLIKPSLDRLFAFVLFFCLLPLMLFVALYVFVFINKKVIFTQARPGKDEKIFTLFKFVSMNDDKDANGELLSDAMRLKKAGKILRASSLDELPQLLNVMLGDMSFIGPRPLLVEYLAHYNENERKRHSVKPGITGLAQVRGRNAISWEEKFALDLEYVENLSLALDAKIFIQTFKKIIKRDGISAKENVTMEKFTR
ncbi:MAG: lipid carrier--UDP-N-acetylgalactosaminyltransferase [Deltaproteobacteria bacterium]|nr:MAG: lipid carrier--UDP-N-acetylgalactosaminyltransferase [Deltaproteobacteria bacterium]